MGCVICGRPAEYHHSKCFRRRDHRYGLPLCPEHHRLSKNSVHGCGNERKFFAKYDIDPEEWARREWGKTQLEIASV